MNFYDSLAGWALGWVRWGKWGEGEWDYVREVVCVKWRELGVRDGQRGVWGGMPLHLSHSNLLWSTEWILKTFNTCCGTSTDGAISEGNVSSYHWISKRKQHLVLHKSVGLRPSHRRWLPVLRSVRARARRWDGEDRGMEKCTEKFWREASRGRVPDRTWTNFTLM